MASNEAIKKLVRQLPELNMAVLAPTFRLLHELAKHSDVTKMDASNLGIVFGPGILWEQNQDALTMLQNTKAVTAIAETLIAHYSLFFPEAPAAAATPPVGKWQSSSVPRKPSQSPTQMGLRRKSLFNMVPQQAVAKAAIDDREPAAVQRRAIELFHTYDKDHSGFLDLDEFLAFFIDLLQVAKLHYFSSDDIMALMQSLSEGDMKLTQAQFQQWWEQFHASLLTDE